MLARTAPLSSPSLHREALLSLRFVRDDTGRTALAESYAGAPFRVFAADRLADGALVVQVTMLGPGVAAGDRLVQRIAVEPGAHAIVLFTSANKLLGSPSGEPAAQDIRMDVAGTGSLEYYPGLTIPFPDAVFEQRTHVCLGSGARFGILELWAMGRIHRDEQYEFASIDSRTDVRVARRPAYADALVLTPRSQPVDGYGLMEGNRYAASGYWQWDAALPQTQIVERDMTLVTGVPSTGSLYLRGLANDGIAFRRAIREQLACQRAAWRLAPLELERYAPSFA